MAIKLKPILHIFKLASLLEKKKMDWEEAFALHLPVSQDVISKYSKIGISD